MARHYLAATSYRESTLCNHSCPVQEECGNTDIRCFFAVNGLLQRNDMHGNKSATDDDITNENDKSLAASVLSVFAAFFARCSPASILCRGATICFASYQLY